MKKYLITPVPKPRQTRSDKWKKRPCVERYRSFKDQCRLHRVELPKSGAHVLFKIPMPKSWSKLKKKVFNGQPHEVRPDLDNFLKSLFDSVYKEDSSVWDVRATKVWAYKGEIIIK